MNFSMRQLLIARAIIRARHQARLREYRRRLYRAYLAHKAAQESLRDRNHVQGSQIPAQHMSSWYHVFLYGDDGTFLSLVGLNKKGFSALLSAFEKEYIVASGPRAPGRPRTVISKHAILSCLLHKYRSCASHSSLSSHFAIPPSTLSRNLRQAETALCACLQSIEDSSITWLPQRSRLSGRNWWRPKSL